jgi:bleomycin hydrolase
LHDEKIFNLNLKGLGPNGEYPGPRVNQYSSGRCWLFATSTSAAHSLEQQLTVIANVLRYNVIEKLNLGDFQLSQNYLFFYDKLEKANYYLE